MIDVFSGEYLFHPAAIQISGNTCSHDCFYCFANNRKKARYFKLSSVINRLRRTTPKTHLDHLLNNGYPICISNVTDPFSKNNYLQTLSVAPYLFGVKNGIFIQTKGGYGIDEFLSMAEKYGKRNIVWYITMTTYNDATSKMIEPNAPSSSERIELARKLKSLGYHVIAAYNPLVEQWLPFDDVEKLTAALRNIGVNDVVLEPLHISNKEIANMPKSKSKHITDEIQAVLNMNYKKDIEGKYNSYFYRVLDYLESEGVVCFKLGMPRQTQLFNNIREHIGLIFPNVWDVINYCFEQDYSKGYVLTHDVYQDVLTQYNKPFFDMHFNRLSNDYILMYNASSWMGHPSVQRIDTHSGIFKHYWNNPKMKASLQNNHLFRVIVDDKGDAIKDEDNNLLLYFDGGIHTKNRVICLT